MRYKTYENYKESNIFWINNIPTNWDINLVKHHFYNKKQIVGDLVENYERLALTLNGVIKRSKHDNEGLQPEKFETYQIVRKNSLIFKLIDLENIRTSRVGLSKFEGLVSPAYIVLNPKKDIFPKYAEYYFLNMWYDNIFNKLGSVGVRSNLNKEDLLNIPFILPPFDEQSKIANFLDRKTSEIDNNIRKNKELISFLEEKKISLINQVVTKGLNPNVQMKNSGIEWIDEIPEHWETNRLSFFFKELKNKNISGHEKNLLSLSYGKIIQKDIESVDGLLPENFNSYNIIGRGDIVLRLTDLQNDKKSLRVGLSNEKGIITSAYVTIRKTSSIINEKYFYYLLHCYDLIKVFYNMGNGVRQNLNYSELSKLMCILPPYDEQKEICKILDDELQKIDDLISKINKQNNIFEKYKTSLIHHVVTGKIDVRTEIIN